MQTDLTPKAASDCTLEERITALEQGIFGSLAAIQIRNSQRPPFALGNSVPLGLLGFTVTAFLTAVVKISSNPETLTSGFFAFTVIFLGGFAQILTAIFQLLQNNTHGAATFGLFGFHGITVGFRLLVLSVDSVNFFSPGDERSSAAYSGLLALMTFVLFLPTLRMNALFSILFLLVMIVFATEVPAAHGVRTALVVSGVVQAISGAFGAYLAALILVNEAWEKEVLPIFAFKRPREVKEEDSLDEIFVPRRCSRRRDVSSIQTEM